MKLSEVVEVLSNPEPYGGTAAQQVERRQREIKARKEAVDFILTCWITHRNPARSTARSCCSSTLASSRTVQTVAQDCE